jgi:hypothetical protein
VVERRAVRLLCGFSFVSVSSPHSIQRADPMVPADYVAVVEQDIAASKTDNLFCPLPQGTLAAEPEPDCSGRGLDSLPGYQRLRFYSLI